MFKYKWDLYELKNNIEVLQKLYENETNKDNKSVILEYIEMYQYMLMLVSKSKVGNKILNDDLEYEDIDSLIDEQIFSYQNNDLNIVNMVLQSYLPFKDVYFTNYSLNNIPLIATNQDLVDVTNDFFKKMLPNSLIKEFQEGIKNNHSIQFSYTKKNDNYSGVTLFDSVLKKKYIYISRTNMLVDLVVLPHEAFHYFLNDYDVYIMTKYNMYYTTEIEGGFANILFGDYFYNYSSENKNYFNQYFLEVFHDGISQLVVKNSFLDAIKDNQKLRMNKFNKTLSIFDLMPFTDTQEILEYFTDPLEINIKYTLGYLAAIDLYYIYQKDPELAFYLLKNIKFIKQEHDVINALRRNHITFMDDGYENLKKYVKKIERQS